MRHLLILLFSLTVGTSIAQKKKTVTPNQPLQGIDTTLERVLLELKAPGMAVAVVHKNQIVLSKGYGFSDWENKIPVTDETPFAIGSCTKAFTAALMGVLDKEGKLNLDEKVRKYLPELTFFNDEMNQYTTVRDVITHRTGLPRHDYSWYGFPSKSRDSLLKRIQYQEPTFGLRQRWQYNNFMYLVQGMISEKLMGKTWEENVKNHLLDPLNMKHTYFSVNQLSKDPKGARGYQVWKDSIIEKMPYYDIDAMGPAGSIISNVKNLSNWLQLWIYGGKWNDKEVLPTTYIQEAISAQSIISAGLPGKEKPELHFSTYGFGWFMSSYKGHYRVEHGGNIDGFSANIAFFPSDSLGIIVLTNQNGSSVNNIVRNILADRMLGLKQHDWLGEKLEADKKAKESAKAVQSTISSNKKERTTTSHPLSAFDGLYSHPGYGTIDVAFRNDSLHISFGKHNDWLKHVHYNIFQPFTKHPTRGIDTAENSPARVHFTMNDAGDIDGLMLQLEPTLEALKWKRQVRAVAISADNLKKYEGIYEFAPGAEAKFYLKNNILFAFIAGQPEYELVPSGKNKFALKVLNGFYTEFEMDKEGNPTSVSFIQPNGTFKAKKKK